MTGVSASVRPPENDPVLDTLESSQGHESGDPQQQPQDDAVARAPVMPQHDESTAAATEDHAPATRPRATDAGESGIAAVHHGVEREDSVFEEEAAEQNKSEEGQTYPWIHEMKCGRCGCSFIGGLDELEEDVVPPRVHIDPGQPTEKDVEEHRDAAHLPYRNWCPECVAGRGTGEQHRKSPEESKVPTIAFDYLIINRAGKVVARGAEDGEEIALKVLIVKDSKSKAVFAHGVRVKGPGDDGYPIRCLAGDIKWLGYSIVRLKSDNEAAILKLLKDALTAVRIEVAEDEEEEKTIQEEHPPAFDHASNGLAENAVKAIEGLMRTLKMDLENRMGYTVPNEHPLMHWLVEHVAWALTTRLRGQDGLSAYQRSRGKTYGKRLVRFGEKVLYKLPADGPRAPADKLQPRWKYGYVLGYSRSSNEYRLITDEGKYAMARSVQRVPADQRWVPAALQAVKATPQDTAAHAAPGPIFVEKAPEDGPATKKARVPPRVLLKKSDFEQYGYTSGCPKCDHARTWGWGQTTLHHSATCVARLSAELEKTEAGRRRLAAAKERADRWTAREGEKLMQSDDIPRAEEEREEQVGGEDIPFSKISPGAQQRAEDDELFGDDDGKQSSSPVSGRDVPHVSRVPPGPGVEHPGGSAPQPGEGESEAEASEFPEGFGPMEEDEDVPADGPKDMDVGAIVNRAPATRPRATDAGVSGGAQAPTTRPRATDVDQSETAEVHRNDLDEVLQLCRADEDACKAIKRHDEQIMALVHALGGNKRTYARERRAQLRGVVSEIYSPPRVTAAAKLLPNLKMLPGFALDLTTKDHNGEEWDFSKSAKREQARALIKTEKPMFLIGSPMCRRYSSWQALNDWHRDPAQVRREQVAADVHLQFVAELYAKQVNEGRYFLHEHPAWATSWDVPCIRQVGGMPGVDQVIGDQCQYDKTTPSGNPMKKPTKWMSNAPRLLRALGQRCRGLNGRCSRPGGGMHEVCSGKITRWAAIYPFELCRAILTGCRDQLRDDERYTVGLVGIMPRPDAGMSLKQLQRRMARKMGLDVDELISEMSGQTLAETPGRQACPRDSACVRDDMRPPANPRGMAGVSSERGRVGVDAEDDIGDLLDSEGVQAFVNAVQATGKYRDSLTGQPLDDAMVEAARRKELEYFNSLPVWELRPWAEARERQGKPPISIKWVDVNKGDDECPNYRSRLVAREIRRPGESPIFAPTPPLESIRTVISLAATDLHGEPKHIRDAKSAHRTQVSFIDIKRAYLCARVDPDDPTYVALPDGHAAAGTGKCALLLRHLYGTRKAGDGWHCEYSSTLASLGFSVGVASACVFWHPEKRLRCSVYGDDLTTVGPKSSLDWFRAQLEKHYELTESARLGPGAEDDREARILNRVVRWTDAGLEYEADPRQCERLVRDMKLEGCKSLSTPGVKVTTQQVAEDVELGPEKASPFRAVAARGNYLAADRLDIQFPAKETCRWMSKPTELGLSSLKRLGRYLEGKSRLVFRYPWQEAAQIDVYSDTDWAGCIRTRKSTSGGVVLLGSHLIKSWSSTQALVALSSGEAEYYGVVKSAGVGLGYQSLLEDLGITAPLRVWTDSTATMGICARQGLGKLRHIDTHCLWVQQRVRDGSIELRKVRGEQNPADLFTKHLSSSDRAHGLLEMLGCEFRGGRAATAPKLRSAAGTSKGEMLHISDGDRGCGTAPVALTHTARDTVPTPEEQRRCLGSAMLVEWHGRTFPQAGDGDEGLPEAYECSTALLPHLHGDLDEWFPRAHAGAELEVTEPPEDGQLEAVGAALGARRNSSAPAESDRCAETDSVPAGVVRPRGSSAFPGESRENGEKHSAAPATSR